jgi:hypothetical protein
MAVSSWFSQLQNGDFPELCGCLPEGTITDKSTLQRGGWNFTAFRDGWVCPPVSAVFAGTSCWIEACPSLSVRFTFQTKQTQKLHLNILQLSNVVCSKLRDTPHATFYPQKKNKSTSIHDSATAQLQFIRVSRESTGWKGSLGSLPSSLVHFDLKCGPSYWQNISNTKKRKPARGLFILVAQSLEMMVFFRFQMDFLQNLVVRFCHRSCDLALAKDAPGHLQIHFRKGFPYMAGTQ